MPITDEIKREQTICRNDSKSRLQSILKSDLMALGTRLLRLRLKDGRQRHGRPLDFIVFHAE